MRIRTLATTALLLTLGAGLAGCGGVADNRTMYSVHQPVVSKDTYTLDVTTGGYGGLAYGEQGRIDGWFAAMGLKYGDRIYLDDPSASAAIRAAVEAVASRYGVTLADAPVATGSAVASGTARIVIARATATVPGCPDWSAKSDFNPGNATSTNYGCATNANLAAMIADPEDLIHGATDRGNTEVMTSNKAIGAYRTASPTGNGNTVAATGSKGN